jgi:hypothetical protein
VAVARLDSGEPRTRLCRVGGWLVAHRPRPAGCSTTAKDAGHLSESAAARKAVNRHCRSGACFDPSERPAEVKPTATTDALDLPESAATLRAGNRLCRVGGAWLALRPRPNGDAPYAFPRNQPPGCTRATARRIRCLPFSYYSDPPSERSAKLPGPPATTLKVGKPGWRPRSASAVCLARRASYARSRDRDFHLRQLVFLDRHLERRLDALASLARYDLQAILPRLGGQAQPA